MRNGSRNEPAGAMARLAAGLVLALLLAAPASAQGMGGGMMNGGMMGAPAGAPTTSGAGPASSGAWQRLSTYIGDHHLTCLSCHTRAGRGIGPSFVAIARRFNGKAGAAGQIAASISHGVSGEWAGYPPMPGGLATPAEANALARLLLDLGR